MDINKYGTIIPQAGRKPLDAAFQQPVNKQFTTGGNFRIVTAVAQQQGSRPYQEDRFDFQDDTFDSLGYALYSVFDGHGSKFYSSHASKAFIDSVVSLDSFKNGDFEQALYEGFELENERLRREVQPAHAHGGTTATVVLLLRDLKKLYVANVGDSSVIMARQLDDGSLKAIQLNRDHSFDDQSEVQRILQAGGEVANGRVYEQGHGINMTRALGDFEFKAPQNQSSQDFISAKPSVRVYDLTPRDKFILLASDGLWNVIDVQAAVILAAERGILGDANAPANPKRAQNVCDYMVDYAASVRGSDNVTAIFVLLDWFHNKGNNITS